MSSAGLKPSAAITRGMTSFDVLYGLEALSYRDASLTRREFSAYVSALDLGGRFPGVKAVSFIRRVPEAQREQFVEWVRNDRSLVAGGFGLSLGYRFDARGPSTAFGR